MKKLIALLVFIPTTAFSQEVYPINVNRLCSAIIGIPYESDNLTDKKREEFKECLEFVKYFKD